MDMDENVYMKEIGQENSPDAILELSTHVEKFIYYYGGVVYFVESKTFVKLISRENQPCSTSTVGGGGVICNIPSKILHIFLPM